MRFNLIKREPSYFFENIHEDLERFLKETFGELEPVLKDNAPFERRYHPAIQIVENKDSYKIDVELTGVKKEDIDLELSEDALKISAETKFEKRENDDNLRFSEFRYGKFIRTIPFEDKVNTENPTTEYKDGVLHIMLNKKEPKKNNEVKKLTIN